MPWLIGGTVAGVAAGLLVGWLLWKGDLSRLPAALRAFVKRSLVPLLSIIGFVAILAVAVAIANEDRDHDELWAQLIAAIFLIGISGLLYATGSRQYTAGRRIVLPR